LWLACMEVRLWLGHPLTRGNVAIETLEPFIFSFTPTINSEGGPLRRRSGELATHQEEK
jgi:hypothetical protein